MGSIRGWDLCGSPNKAVGLMTEGAAVDRKSTRLNSSHLVISYAVFCLKKKNRLSFYIHIAGNYLIHNVLKNGTTRLQFTGNYVCSQLHDIADVRASLSLHYFLYSSLCA